MKAMVPRAEIVHWLFAAGFLLFGLVLLAEAVVGQDVWRKRRWRVYVWPVIVFGLAVLLWPVAVFFTSSTLHMLAHTLWAEVALIAGTVQLAVAHGKLTSRWWNLTSSAAMFASGAAFLIHEQNGWLFSRAAFLHHALGWLLVVAAVIPLLSTLRPRSDLWRGAFAASWIAIAVLLFADRDTAPIFGHLSDLAGGP